MSHIVTIKTQIRDPVAMRAACHRLGLDEPVLGCFKIFQAEANGWCVRLTDWLYPIVCNVDTGTVHFDNYRGHWGPRNRLDEFMRTYAIEKIKLEAHKQGHSVFEQPLAEGRTKLTVQLGGNA